MVSLPSPRGLSKRSKARLRWYSDSPFSEISKQVKMLVTHGYKEVVLTGVDICSYGIDLVGKPQLGGLIKDLLADVPDF